MEIRLPILSGCLATPGVYDFSLAGVRIADIHSDEVATYCKSLTGQSIDVSMLPGRREGEQTLVMLMNNPTHPGAIKNAEKVYWLLLLIFPSNIHTSHHLVLGFDENENFNTYKVVPTQNKNIDSRLLKYIETNAKYVAETNEFIDMALGRMEGEDYIESAIDSYLASYTAKNYAQQYSLLWQTLETCAGGTSGLPRNIALLCGSAINNCDIIYENIMNLAKGNTKLNEGQEIDTERLLEYIRYMQALASRSIIELLIHNIPGDQLYEKLKKTRMGHRSLLTPGWKDYLLNVNTIMEAQWKELPELRAVQIGVVVV